MIATIIISSPTTLEPYYLHGPGVYKLSSVKSVAGTDEYLTVAKKKNLCQNDVSMQDCMARQFISESKKKCNCVPFSMQVFNSTVRI